MEVRLSRGLNGPDKWAIGRSKPNPGKHHVTLNGVDADSNRELPSSVLRKRTIVYATGRRSVSLYRLCVVAGVPIVHIFTGSAMMLVSGRSPWRNTGTHPVGLAIADTESGNVIPRYRHLSVQCHYSRSLTKSQHASASCDSRAKHNCYTVGGLRF